MVGVMGVVNFSREVYGWVLTVGCVVWYGYIMGGYLEMVGNGVGCGI